MGGGCLKEGWCLRDSRKIMLASSKHFGQIYKVNVIDSPHGSVSGLAMRCCFSLLDGC